MQCGSANDERLTTNDGYLPSISAPAGRPDTQGASDHRNLAHVIAIVRHHLPEHSLKRSREFRIAFVHRFDLPLHFLLRRICQLGEIRKQAGKALS